MYSKQTLEARTPRAPMIDLRTDKDLEEEATTGIIPNV